MEPANLNTRQLDEDLDACKELLQTFRTQYEAEREGLRRDAAGLRERLRLLQKSAASLS
jgi:hypothetical protein